MIDKIKGILSEKSTNFLVIDCGGVGYHINVSLKTSELMPQLNAECEIFTILIPREDSLTLYGFATKDERELFKKIISISGIGPKIALGILSSVTSSEFKNYIINNMVKSLEKLPGIGKKTAERLCLELKDKFKKDDIGALDTGLSISSNLLADEAVSALISLGYNKNVAEKSVNIAVNELSGTEITIENLIKKSLRIAIK